MDKNFRIKKMRESHHDKDLIVLKLMDDAKSAEALLSAMSSHRDEKAIIEERDILRNAIQYAKSWGNK